MDFAPRLHDIGVTNDTRFTLGKWTLCRTERMDADPVFSLECATMNQPLQTQDMRDLHTLLGSTLDFQRSHSQRVYE